MMQCYTEILPPSGVGQAISLPFTSATATNLIVGKTSLLQVFETTNGNHEKLSLVAEYFLSGTITALARVKILNPKSGGEAVLVALRDAKLTLLEWDPDTNGISTLSIHYYESEDLHKCPWAPDISQCISHLAVDPGSRCAAFNFGVSNLAIIPFHQAGDDLVMDDYDPDLDGDRHDATSPTTLPNGDSSIYKTPYASSFVLPLSALDPGLVYPISVAFLHEYREPTLGILYSSVASSNSLLHERKDVVSYAVFTLDLEQRASTTLLSVARLPNDLHKVFPMPLPVGGVLLVGANELVHVDQGGKTNAVGVNEFARRNSSFSMADNSDRKMRLENCVVEYLGSEAGDVVLMMSTGELGLVSFKLDGRSVSGVSIRHVPFGNGGEILKGCTSCSASLGRSKFFIGSEESDSTLIGWSRRSGQIKRQKSQIGSGTATGASSEEEEEMDDYDDDLYGTADDVHPIQRVQTSDAGTTTDYVFRIHDTLPSIAPIKDIVLGKTGRTPTSETADDNNPASKVQLVVASGSGRAGGVAVLKREIEPVIVRSSESSGVTGLWSVQIKDSTEADIAAVQPTETLDRFLITSRTTPSGEEESTVHAIVSRGLRELEGTDFDSTAGVTVEVGSLARGTRAVQVLKNEVRSYDSSFGLSQIYPMTDDDGDVEAKVMSASFADPYLLILRDDQSVLILEADDSGDLDEVERSTILMSTKWSCGSLYKDHSGVFGGGVILFLVSLDNCLQAFPMNSFDQPSFRAQGANLLPRLLPSEPSSRRSGTREPLTEVLVADLGDSVARSPYLVTRTRKDEIALYEPYREGSSGRLRFSKVPGCHLDRVPSDEILDLDDLDQEPQHSPLRTISNVGGYSAIFLPGQSPTFIMKSRLSSPHLHPLHESRVKAFGSLNTTDCSAGFAYIDDNDNLQMGQLDPYMRYGESALLSRKVELGDDVNCLAYFMPTRSYILGASRPADFKLPDDDEWHTEWKDEAASFLPQVEQGSIRVMSSSSWKVIDTYMLEPAERPMCIKALSLETSEDGNERTDLIVVGTAITKGEDVSARGSIYIFDIVDVVPESDEPETHHKLKLVAKEDVKGPVTALTHVGSQGFLLAAQGQKCMVRGLKEDLTILPVAFMDMRYYVKVAKELKGTGLCILGDAMDGLWLTGYSEEPYKLALMGKDSINLDVVVADFLPDGKELYIVAADGNCDLHVFQYDPERK